MNLLNIQHEETGRLQEWPASHPIPYGWAKVSGLFCEGSCPESLALVMVPRTHPTILQNMAVHYSAPKGFVGRNICYLVKHDGFVYGSIVGGSATRFLPGRSVPMGASLNNGVNNIFFHIEPDSFVGIYPVRNFSQKAIAAYRLRIEEDWNSKYGDEVLWHETLVEPPRTGECYKRDGWILVGQTKGYTCKRTSGNGTDAWSGRRVWDTKNLRPKLVFVRPVDGSGEREAR